MSTLNEREALLRKALLAAAEAIEPGGDGLQLIRARLRPAPRSLAVAWAEALWTELVLRAPAGLLSGSRGLAGAIRGWRERLMPQTGSGARSLRLLRPLAAATAVFIVAAGAYAAFDSPQSLFSTNSSNSPVSGGGGTTPRSGGGASGTSSTSGRGAGPVRSAGNSPGSSNQPDCTSARTPKNPSGSTAPAPSVSSSPISSAPAQSDSPSPSVSPSPSPTGGDSSSPDPSASSSSPASGSSSPPGSISGDTSPPPSRVVASPKPTGPCAGASSDHGARNSGQGSRKSSSQKTRTGSQGITESPEAVITPGTSVIKTTEAVRVVKLG